MKLAEHPLYREDLERCAELALPWEKLSGKTVVISGATGMIGSFLIDVLAFKNEHSGADIRIAALGRSAKKAEARFGDTFGKPYFAFYPCDINTGEGLYAVPEADFVIHLASNTHPVAYATDPIGTVTANVIGTSNLLAFAAEKGAERFAFASSNEIYGENRGDAEKFDESYCGYIDCNTLRAGYPESKRCGEALCQAYIRQKGLDVVIPRLTRSYGPTLLASDTKAMTQFLHKGIAGEDIILKSAGTQYYSYTYTPDAVGGLLTVLLLGQTGEAYNIADDASDIMLKDLAALIAANAGTKVVFELPDAVESAGFSKATKARLESAKLQGLGWKAQYTIREGIARTMTILKDLEKA